MTRKDGSGTIIVIKPNSVPIFKAFHATISTFLICGKQWPCTTATHGPTSPETKQNEDLAYTLQTLQQFQQFECQRHEMYQGMRKALAQILTWVSNLRFSLFCASICGVCKPGIACDFSCKLVKLLGFWQWLFVVKCNWPWSFKFSNVCTHITKTRWERTVQVPLNQNWSSAVVVKDLFWK